MVLVNTRFIINFYRLVIDFTARSLVGVNIVFKIGVKYVINNGFA